MRLKGVPWSHEYATSTDGHMTGGYVGRQKSHRLDSTATYITTDTHKIYTYLLLEERYILKLSPQSIYANDS